MSADLEEFILLNIFYVSLVMYRKQISRTINLDLKLNVCF